MRRFREAIKADIMGFLLLCFLIGVSFIWFAGDFTDFHLSNDARVSDTVLWLTSLAIFWYAYETYQLKQSTSDQVNLQEEIMLNEFLPIIEPTQKGRGPILTGKELKGLRLRNLGKGPAKYIEVYIDTVKVSLDSSLASDEAETVSLGVSNKRAMTSVLAGNPDRIKLKITYQDIYNRKFKTDNIFLDKTGRGNYSLREGAWDFKRVSKPKSR